MHPVIKMIQAAQVERVLFDIVAGEVVIESSVPGKAEYWARKLKPHKAEVIRYLSEGSLEDPPPVEDPRIHITTPANEIAKRYMDQLRKGKVQQLITQHQPLAGVEIGSGLITIIGAPPGAGKTALAMQIVFDALSLDPELSVTIANAETTFDGLLRREITRRSRIKSDAIRFGKLSNDELDEIEKIIVEITPALSMINVVEECNLANVKRLFDDPPGLLILDYLQKFAPPGTDARTGCGLVMAEARTLAKAGWAVVLLSATARQKDGKHEDKALTMSSYRDSGEIEFNADSCYLLLDHGPIDEGCDYIRKTELKHVKNRHGAKVDKTLQFHMPRMSFEAWEPEPDRHSEFDEFEGDF